MSDGILVPTRTNVRLRRIYARRPNCSALSAMSFACQMRCKPHALRVLDASREVINATVAALWERLDDFGERETKYAYKQVTALIASSDPHGDRQWRCEAEQAGRILRGQARRKKQFALVLPLLEQGMILPKTEHTRAGKNRTRSKRPWPACVMSTAMGAVRWNCKA